MSADTSVIVVKSPYGFTAEVVQAAESFLVEDSTKIGKAFLSERHLWLSTLPLAKQLAQILAEDEEIKYNGPQYPDRIYLEIESSGHVFPLSKKGRRLPKSNHRYW